MVNISTEEIKKHTSQLNIIENIAFYGEGEMPKLTIITPSYNQVQHIEKTILSVLNQGYPKLEYIIIDGGSTDGSVEVIKKYNDYIAYWVSEKDKGQSHAVNKGLAVASGEWIGWQNSDDIYLPGTFKRFVEVLIKNPKAEIIYGNKLFIDESDKVLGKRFFTRPNVFIYKYAGMTLSNQSSFFKRSLTDRFGDINEKLTYAMDREFFLRFVLNRVNMIHDKLIWGAVRFHGESKSCSGKELEWQEEHKVIHGKFYSAHKVIFSPLARLLKYIYTYMDNRCYMLEELVVRLKRKIK